MAHEFKPRKRVLVPRDRIMVGAKASPVEDNTPEPDIFSSDDPERPLITTQLANGMWRVQRKGGGHTPSELIGTYTSQAHVLKAIETWQKLKSQ